MKRMYNQQKIRATKEVYGFLWNKSQGYSTSLEKGHFSYMQETVTEPIVRGGAGIDIGCGMGQDTYLMAKNNPGVSVIALDLSDGVYKTRELVRGLNNAAAVKGSVTALPVRSEALDFAYSFGVLHHIPDPKKGLFEINRVLKKGSPVFLYLYEDHSGNILKYLTVKTAALFRKITVRIPRKILYALSFLASPFVFIVFSCPAIILSKFDKTRSIAENIPFNFGRSPFGLRSDLFDRFGAPIEYRFSKKQVYELLDNCNFHNITITKLKATAGWVAWAYKRPDKY
ncbi:MAG: class I SAM-dependent methyltransferase [Candidatus Omnitrophota bacterium]|nr:class I SAM-dependent methyltransferase [Candidatus Omnitrophota bacterium]